MDIITVYYFPEDKKKLDQELRRFISENGMSEDRIDYNDFYIFAKYAEYNLNSILSFLIERFLDHLEKEIDTVSLMHLNELFFPYCRMKEPIIPEEHCGLLDNLIVFLILNEKEFFSKMIQKYDEYIMKYLYTYARMEKIGSSLKTKSNL